MPDELPLLPDREDVIALDELMACSGLAHDEVVELVEFGALALEQRGTAWTFHSRTLWLARRAARLRDDFGLNTPGMAVALAYLERIERLERRLRELEACLPKGDTGKDSWIA
ncbi:MAG: chaperone modulator CbpM [Cyanobacteriota bacterium]|jgi:chaperone modulatory protein CbpM